MKKITDIGSPITLILIFAAAFFCAGLVFQFTFQQFIVLFVFDTAIVPLAALLERRLYNGLYPDSPDVFPDFNEKSIYNSFLRDAVGTYKRLAAFPGRRALFLFFFNMSKVSLTGLLVVFYLDHQCSNLEQFAKYMVFELMAMSYFSGVYFIECTGLVSKIMAELHAKYDISASFNKIPKLNYKKDLQFVTIGTIGFITLWSLSLNLIAHSLSSGSEKNLIAELITIDFFAMVFVVRCVFLYTDFFSETVKQFNAKMKTLEEDVLGQRQYNTQSLHSNSLIASLDQIYNSLIERLKRRDRQISQLRNLEIEQSRFRALGELSAMVTHDLAGPLHVIMSCADIVQDRYGDVIPPRVMKEMQLNIERCSELVTNLRAFVKNPKESAQKAHQFKDVHDYVVALLHTQYRPTVVTQSIRFHFDARLENVFVRLSRVDLSHILYNLYKNAMDDFVRNANVGGEISILMNSLLVEQGKIEISLKDNGSGLAREDFERMVTSDYLPESNGIGGRKGLGVRLVAMMLDKNDCQIQCVDTKIGTSLRFWLPVVINEVNLAQQNLVHSLDKSINYKHNEELVQ